MWPWKNVCGIVYNRTHDSNDVFWYELIYKCIILSIRGYTNFKQ